MGMFPTTTCVKRFLSSRRYSGDGVPWAEPWKVKTVELIKMTSKAEREVAIKKAGFNTFLLKSEDVYIDLLTDSGTNAMSADQWAALMRGDEAYAGATSFYELEAAVKKYYGYQHLIPTHQGRGAEHLLSKILIKPGDYVPGNMYFTTTRIHQELCGGTFVDVIVDEAHDSQCNYMWKGNVDLKKLKELVDRVGAEKVPYLSLETSVNMAGGQPVSLTNIRETYKYCKSKNIKVMLDATRACENSMFIKNNEPEFFDKSIESILLEICSNSDGCTMSGKKDSLVNIGGFLALNDPELTEKAQGFMVIYEGLHTYGGMSGRDMAAMATGMSESVTEAHLQARIGQVRYLHESLAAAGVPLVHPCGGHGVYVDAKKFLPHLSQDEFPAQALAAALYADSGVRAMERGNVSAGRDPKTGKNRCPELELVRLTIPRRVYTQSHMDVVSYSIKSLYEKRDNVRGLRFVFEPKDLRFFLAKFEQI